MMVMVMVSTQARRPDVENGNQVRAWCFDFELRIRTLRSKQSRKRLSTCVHSATSRSEASIREGAAPCKAMSGIVVSGVLPRIGR